MNNVNDGKEKEHYKRVRHRRHRPGFIIRLILGNDLFEIISMDCRVSNAKAKRVLGWKPEFPSYREGLAETIPGMKERKNYFE